MKLASLVAMIASLALCSIESASAASACTQSEAAKIRMLSGTILADANCLDDTFAYCPNAECSATVEKVVKQMPSCISDGTNFKETFQSILTDCEAVGVSDTPTSTTTAPLITTKTPSSTTTTTKTPSSTSTTTTSPSATIASIIGGGSSAPSTGKSGANGRSSSLSVSVAVSSAIATAAVMMAL